MWIWILKVFCRTHSKCCNCTACQHLDYMKQVEELQNNHE